MTDIQRNTITTADALAYAKSLPDESVNCIITSPPYFGLRDYGVTGQMGLEQTFPEFIAAQVELFAELRRVLRDDGTCWVNMGDAYATSPNTRDLDAPPRHLDDRTFRGKPIDTTKVLPAKNLLGQPWRLAFALQDDGWILRRDIIWHKPNPMPESAKDRPTTAHEYIFLLTKKPRYWYDADAVRVANTPQGLVRAKSGRNPETVRDNDRLGANYKAFNREYHANGANLKSVWTIPTQPFAAAHFATFPEKLIVPCIKAGAPKKVCADCGAPWVRDVVAVGGILGRGWGDEKAGLVSGNSSFKVDAGKGYRRIDNGLQPACDCDGETLPGIVYDPFMGSGTTALVAHKLGRDYIGSELNPEYAELARARVAGRLPEYKDAKDGKPTTEYMFDFDPPAPPDNNREGFRGEMGAYVNQKGLQKND